MGPQPNHAAFRKKIVHCPCKIILRHICVGQKSKVAIWTDFQAVFFVADFLAFLVEATFTTVVFAVFFEDFLVEVVSEELLDDEAIAPEDTVLELDELEETEPDEPDEPDEPPLVGVGQVDVPEESPEPSSVLPPEARVPPPSPVP